MFILIKIYLDQHNRERLLVNLCSFELITRSKMMMVSYQEKNEEHTSKLEFKSLPPHFFLDFFIHCCTKR